MTDKAMTKESMAMWLDGNEVYNETTIKHTTTAKESGLVIVYGVSYDIMELEGAIEDEADVYMGGTVYFDENGILANGCTDENCKHFNEAKKRAKKIEAVWHEDKNEALAWTYETDIPHAEFNIFDHDRTLCCVGIVFSINDLKQTNNG